MFLKLFRTLKAGFQNFYRNGWLSIATTSVIVITLFIINIQIAITTANNFLLRDVEGRVNISVYFKPDVSESDVLKVRDEFLKYEEIKSIDYISSEKALEDFKKRNEENETIKKSLEELGSNPLAAVLNVKAKNADQYERITAAIEQSRYKDIIYKVNFHKYRNVIESLNSETKSNQKVAVILGVTLSLIAILITFNSIRITMYSYRQEIEIMRLVGASNTYIRFPFVWEGIFYGVIAGLVVVPLIFIYLKFVSGESASGSILPFSNTVYLKTYLNDYFSKHLILVILSQLAVGVFVGVISSMIAIRKYLKI